MRNGLRKLLGWCASADRLKGVTPMEGKVQAEITYCVP